MLGQLSKAFSPIVITFFGIVTLVKLEHPEKAYSPIVVTKSPIVIRVNLEHPLKA